MRLDLKTLNYIFMKNMKIEIEITEQEVKDLKAIRNYFGEHDNTLFEHKSYAVVDRLVKKLNIPDVIKSACVHPYEKVYQSETECYCEICGHDFTKQTVL